MSLHFGLTPEALYLPHDALCPTPAGGAGREQRVLTVLSESGSGLSLREVLERIGQGITERQARKDLEALQILGLAQATGHGRGSRWRLS